jgi:nucleotide-binding universal stress UspA family protein
LKRIEKYTTRPCTREQEKEATHMSAAQACPISGLKSILLATDGSVHSENAMKEAISLAKACATKIYAISVVEVNPEYEALAPKAVEKAEIETKQFLDAAKECAKRENLKLESIAHRGEDPAEFIVKEAEKLKIDMIVMGKHGKKRGLKKLLMGSVTAKVLAHSTCKVLVVP